MNGMLQRIQNLLNIEYFLYLLDLIRFPQETGPKNSELQLHKWEVGNFHMKVACEGSIIMCFYSKLTVNHHCIFVITSDCNVMWILIIQ